MWTLRGLIDHCNANKACINSLWVPARPLDCDSFWQRLKYAWAVFRHKADAFTWPEGQ
jgi:hypothetical protein